MRRRVTGQLIQSKLRKASFPQQQLRIKTISISHPSQIDVLKENLPGKQPLILIARIASMVSRDPDVATKFVNELYSTHIKNNYSVFRLGEDRFIVVPDGVQVENIL